jgi:hypothetical protein
MNPVAKREDVQERLLEYLRGITGVAIGGGEVQKCRASADD